MSNVNFEAIVGKLNDQCFRALEDAVGLCNSRRNYYVEIEHVLHKLAESSNLDLHAILRHFNIDVGRVLSELTRSLDRLERGGGRTPEFSDTLIDWLREAWLIGSLDHQSPRIRSGHLFAALFTSRPMMRQAIAASPSLEAVSREKLQADFSTIVRGTSEDKGLAPEATGPRTEGAAPSDKTAALDRFTIDLTERARGGHIDPIIGRDPEIRQVIDILTRRRQNNPILTGEAGVGKTAVAEGFALRVAAGDVPEHMKNVVVRSLDLGLLQAGAGVRGEFENRLKSVIEEVKSSPVPVILFIDEAHTLIGAGGSSGQGDAANLLKPALARGELRAIAATTWAEYKKYFEKDAALARRFQVVKVEEPTTPVAVAMIRGLVGVLEKHHGIRILSEAVDAAVHLSDRYISGRQLPDKAVSLLDTACAKIAISQHATPPALEDCQRAVTQLQTTIGILEREALAGASNDKDLSELTERLVAEQSRLQTLTDRWEHERELARRIADARVALEQPVPEGETSRRPELLEELSLAQNELRNSQEDEPLVHACVDSQAVAETVAAWTGIPVGRMMADQIDTVLNLRQSMEQSIAGQSHALEAIARSIQTSRANLTDPVKPIGVFLLAGTSGVGKTETAITLANLLYGGEQNMTVINMSEFKEEHKVSLLMGSPPGYVGYGEGGVLTEAVRRKPYSVVLLDEMEKAHPGVQDIFYQVFDKGTLKDGEGRDIDFRNTVILMTTNAGTDLIKSLCLDEETRPDAEAFAEAVFPELLKTFKPAFLGRLKVIPYYPLAPDVLRKIIQLKLGKIVRRVGEHYRANLTYDDAVVEEVASRCTEADTGARNIDNILAKTLQPELSIEFLKQMRAGKPIAEATVTVDGDGQFVYSIR